MKDKQSYELSKLLISIFVSSNTEIAELNRELRNIYTKLFGDKFIKFDDSNFEDRFGCVPYDHFITNPYKLECDEELKPLFRIFLIARLKEDYMLLAASKFQKHLWDYLETYQYIPPKV